MQQDIVAQGVELMLYGMGTVVVFLALLVVATTAMSAVVMRYFPVTESLDTAPAERLPVNSGGSNAQLVAVISAAIKQHRSRRDD